jgi:hypothetical protein
MYVKYPLFLWEFNNILIFSTNVRKSINANFFSKRFQLKPSCLMRTDGQTDDGGTKGRRDMKMLFEILQTCLITAISQHILRCTFVSKNVLQTNAEKQITLTLHYKPSGKINGNCPRSMWRYEFLDMALVYLKIQTPSVIKNKMFADRKWKKQRKWDLCSSQSLY